MTQHRTEAILSAVTWANAKLAELNLSDTVCVVYTNGHARLLGRMGREMIVAEHDDPWVACGCVVLRLTMGLQRLLDSEKHTGE